jgi:HPt (histidine-containing phosphotransfer) domain-containing protein
MSTLQREALDAIRELGGDTPDLLQQIVHLYLDAAPGLLQQMKAGFASGDLTSVRNAAHTLKSSSANLGAAQLSRMCSQLEAAARAGAIGPEVPSAQAIESEYEGVKSALLAEIA